MNINHHHDGIISVNIEKDIFFYKKLGYKLVKSFKDDNQKIEGCFLKGNSDVLIELIKPYDENKTLDSFIKKNIKIYHHCFICDSVEKFLNSIDLNYILTKEPMPATAFENRLVYFIYLENNLLIELVDNNI